MLKHSILRFARLAEDRLRQVLRLNQSQETLASDAQRFWERPIDAKNSFWWHQRDSSPFADADDNWHRIGRRHVALFADLAKLTGVERPVGKIVDWGCGGGANCVAFATECRAMWGVDVSADALVECEKQVAAVNQPCAFHGIKVDVTHPEAALTTIPHDIDLFHCSYVFELFPSKEYGIRILKLVHALLRPGGLALIQIKYETDSWKTRARRWGYARGAGNMTTYRVEEFWESCTACGLEPKAVVLVPKPEEVPDERYAYFMLQKRPE